MANGKASSKVAAKSSRPAAKKTRALNRAQTHNSLTKTSTSDSSQHAIGSCLEQGQEAMGSGFTHVLPTKEQRSSNGKLPGRKLIQWKGENTTNLLLLNLQYAAWEQGVELPWAEAAHRLHPGTSAQAPIQHLARLRKELYEEGYVVPPLQKKAHSDPEVRGLRKRLDGSGPEIVKYADAVQQLGTVAAAPVKHIQQNEQYGESEEHQEDAVLCEETQHHTNQATWSNEELDVAPPTVFPNSYMMPEQWAVDNQHGLYSCMPSLHNSPTDGEAHDGSSFEDTQQVENASSSEAEVHFDTIASNQDWLDQFLTQPGAQTPFDPSDSNEYWLNQLVTQPEAEMSLDPNASTESWQSQPIPQPEVEMSMDGVDMARCLEQFINTYDFTAKRATEHNAGSDQ